MLEERVQTLVERYQTVAPDNLRVALWYDGDDHSVSYVRDSVRESYSTEEFERKIQGLITEGFSEAPTQEEFRLFGEETAVVHQYDRTLVLYFPVDEFAGVAVTLDRNPLPSIDTLVDLGTETMHDQETKRSDPQ